MIIAYWLIGREIVQAIQGGEERAEYGKQIIKNLSGRLNRKYGKGFSISNLQYFRQFYIVYQHREPKIRHKACGESDAGGKHHKACGVLDDMSLAVEKSDSIQGFSPALSWSHYRALAKVEHKNERLFYEIEAIARYSVLSNSKQLFASKYMLYLPTEEELEQELKRERRLIDGMVRNAGMGAKLSV